MLNIVVCMKQVLDPEAPVSGFKIDEHSKSIIPPPGTMPVLSPFDENALEAALKIKDTQGDTKITVLSMGPSLAKPVFLRTMATGADQVILLDDPIFREADSFFTATTLAETIKQIGCYDVIFCGRQAADTDAGLVGPGIAEMLEISLVTMAQKVEAYENRLRVEQINGDGYDILDVQLPVLITVSNEMGDLRYPTTKNLLASKKAKPTVWDAGVLNIDFGTLKKMELIDMYIPIRKVDCQMAEGTSPEEAAVQLAVLLQQDGVI